MYRFLMYIKIVLIHQHRPKVSNEIIYLNLEQKENAILHLHLIKKYILLTLKA